MMLQAGSTQELTVIPPRINHVLIDHENVQPGELKLLDRMDVRIWIFVGASQGKIATGLAIDAHAMADRVSFMQISAQGSNALDFHIAYYLGKLCSQEPASFFHILSKDTGFDPLVTHLRGQGHKVYRVPTMQALAFLPKPHNAGSGVAASTPAPAAVAIPAPVAGVPAQPAVAAPAKPEKAGMSQAQRLAHIRENLQKPKATRPAKHSTLRNHVLAQFHKQINAQQVDEIINGLVKGRVLQLQGSKVHYL